jgi:hypothetical protein
MANTRTYSRRTRGEVEGILKSYDESGLAQKAFATGQGLSLSTLHYWLNRRRRESRSSVTPTKFVPATISAVADAGGTTDLELEIGGDLRLHIPADIDREVLASLLPVIVAAC